MCCCCTHQASPRWLCGLLRAAQGSNQSHSSRCRGAASAAPPHLQVCERCSCSEAVRQAVRWQFAVVQGQQLQPLKQAVRCEASEAVGGRVGGADLRRRSAMHARGMSGGVAGTAAARGRRGGAASNRRLRSNSSSPSPTAAAAGAAAAGTAAARRQATHLDGQLAQLRQLSNGRQVGVVHTALAGRHVVCAQQQQTHAAVSAVQQHPPGAVYALPRQRPSGQQRVLRGRQRTSSRTRMQARDASQHAHCVRAPASTDVTGMSRPAIWP